MNARPYALMKIDQLEELARSSSDDSDVRRRLLAELEYRTNRRAQRLRSQLEGTNPLDAGSATRAEPHAKPSVITPFSKGCTHEPPNDATCPTSQSSADEHESLLRTFESLRATFTVEAELLARWGMTPALPQEIQDLVFEEWIKRLTSPGNESKRIVESIAEDRIRIVRERDALRGAMKAHGIIIPPPPDVEGAPFIGDDQ